MFKVFDFCSDRTLKGFVLFLNNLYMVSKWMWTWYLCLSNMWEKLMSTTLKSLKSWIWEQSSTVWFPRSSHLHKKTHIWQYLRSGNVMNINSFPFHDNAKHSSCTRNLWLRTLACLCFTHAFASPSWYCVPTGKIFSPDTLNFFCSYPHIFSREKILTTPLLMHSNAILETHTNETIKNKTWSRGTMLFKETEI